MVTLRLLKGESKRGAKATWHFGVCRAGGRPPASLKGLPAGYFVVQAVGPSPPYCLEWALYVSLDPSPSAGSAP